MSDEELIARLRAYREHDEGSGGMASFEVEECIEAADRIEALIEESARRLALIRIEGVARVDQCERAEALEAKLAKAVEALELIVVDSTWGLEHQTYMKCRKALAAIKGESHD